MKKKYAILGSTGSIGKNLLEILKKNRRNVKVVLLSANKNYKLLYKQAKEFNVKNIIINNHESYEKLVKLNKRKKIKIFNSFECFNKIFNKKIDYTMCSITGIHGLVPTFNIVKFTKRIAIANKESIICAWNLIKKEINKHKTEFIPVDSEHFSIWYALKGNINSVDKIILTASGGPFINLPISKFKNIKISEALNHPNWKMGKKISIDSSTLMNKIFEIIEAKKIFDLKYKDLEILIHQKSYVHAIIKFNDGMIKVVAHETDMKIPIYNTLFNNMQKTSKSKKIDLNKLNNLNLQKVKKNKFPVIKILKHLPENSSLFETVLLTANDELVSLYLRNKINYIDISKKLCEFIKKKEFIKYKKISPSSINDIFKLNNFIRIKVNSELR